MNTAPVMITAGGTGGHVIPALTVADELRSRGVPVVWLGTRDGIEARLVPAAGIEIEWLTVTGLRGKGPARWLLAPFVLTRALWQALRVLRRRAPRAVLGMGGFVSGPGGVAARLLSVPLVIHEQNARAGSTNRMLARIAGRVLCAFPGAFPARVAAQVVGNPVRPNLFAVADPVATVPPAQPLRLLVLGGSQGAQSLNRIVPEALASLPENIRPQVRHQAGARNLQTARDAYARAFVAADVLGFIDDMAQAYAWADLVVCRSGALTVSELAAVGRAAILLPYPWAVDDHQRANGEVLVAAGAAELLPEAQLTAAELARRLEGLLGEPERLVRMGQAARTMGAPDATRAVADALLTPRAAA